MEKIQSLQRQVLNQQKKQSLTEHIQAPVHYIKKINPRSLALFLVYSLGCFYFGHKILSQNSPPTLSKREVRRLINQAMSSKGSTDKFSRQELLMLKEELRREFIQFNKKQKISRSIASISTPTQLLRTGTKIIPKD